MGGSDGLSGEYSIQIRVSSEEEDSSSDDEKGETVVTEEDNMTIFVIRETTTPALTVFIPPLVHSSQATSFQIVGRRWVDTQIIDNNPLLLPQP